MLGFARWSTTWHLALIGGAVRALCGARPPTGAHVSRWSGETPEPPRAGRRCRRCFLGPERPRRGRRRTPAPLAVGVGARLRMLRQRQRLSQAEVGAPYYTRAYVSAVELEKAQPSLKALAHFASRLGVSTALLAAP